MKIDVVGLGDWVGIYVDGKLQVENHHLNECDAFEAVGLKYNYHEISEFDEGSLPDDFSELKL